LALLLLLSVSGELLAQKRKNQPKFYTGNELKGSRKESGSFLSKQGWLGLKMGINLTQAVPEMRYSSFSPVRNSDLSTDKQYENYNQVGIQAGIELIYRIKFFAISLQPNFRRQVFSYRNEYSWNDSEIPENTLELNYHQEQYLDYIDMPLTVKIEYPANRFKPFIEFGAYYGWLVDANKRIQVSGIDRASGNNRYFERESLSLGVRDLYTEYSAGLIGGIGVNYDAGNIRLSLDAKYRYGLHNLTREENRYSDTRLSGLGDVPDDFRLNTIEINFGILFPMRFLSRDYTATD
jgi:hypothetical protein